MKHFYILGVKISVTSLEKASQMIRTWGDTKHQTYVCVAPVSTIMTCQEDEHYKNIVNQAGMITPDGMPVVWLGKASGHKDIQRTYGPDLMQLVCASGVKDGMKHYLYGGTEETNILLVDKLKHMYPGILIVGSYAPPFRKAKEMEAENILRVINQKNPDVLWVGLGSPKQEYWMAQHRKKLNVSVMVGVGAAFDFLAGTKKQAPVWIQKSGLEWLFRLCCEPQRLWKRYLLGNTKFLYLLCKEFFKRKRS